MQRSIPIHDRVFRHAFDTPETAAELAENLLPSRYRRRIAGAAVSVSAESFVESDLRGRFTDLLIEFKRPPEPHWRLKRIRKKGETGQACSGGAGRAAPSKSSVGRSRLTHRRSFASTTSFDSATTSSSSASSRSPASSVPSIRR